MDDVSSLSSPGAMDGVLLLLLPDGRQWLSELIMPQWYRGVPVDLRNKHSSSHTFQLVHAGNV